MKILRDRPAVLAARGNVGWTALMYAAAYGRASEVRALLAKAADPNIQNDDGATALMYAVDAVEKTRMLLDHGAKSNVRSGEGRTELMIVASGRSWYQVAKLLLERGADATVSVGRQSIIQEAALAGDLPLIRLLLDHGADPQGLILGSLRAAKCRECVELFVPSANSDDLGIAMVGAAIGGNGPLFDASLSEA